MRRGNYNHGVQGRWTPAMDARLMLLVDDEQFYYGDIGSLMRAEFSEAGLTFSKNAIGGRVFRLRNERTGVKTERKKPAKRRLMFRVIKAEIVSHPFVRALYGAMNMNQCSLTQMSERSGVNRQTIANWHRVRPRLIDLEACLNVVGYTMQPHPREEDT